ncbi:unnamed protein product, partial [Cladocopium goreaui]
NGNTDVDGQVLLSEHVYHATELEHLESALEVCLAHALITEREEVMGTLDQANGPGMAHWTEIPA